MDTCPCGSPAIYSSCCEPILNGEREAQTAEELMRSRYTAYVKADIEHILSTILPKNHKNIDENAIRKWSVNTEWLRLEVLNTERGTKDDQTGTVEFIAHYKNKGLICKHHEIGKFQKEKGKWFYDESEFPSPNQFLRSEPKVKRNALCPCGSGKKYKKCCGKAGN